MGRFGTAAPTRGDSAVEAARRELREEAGLSAGEWRHLLPTYPSPGISDELVHVYVARALSAADRGDFVLEHEEAEMETFWVPFDELLAAVLDGRVTHALVALSVLTCAARGLAGTRRPGTGKPVANE